MDNKIENEKIKQYQFQGQYARLTGWFDLYHEWLEELFCTLEPDFYKQLYKINTEVQETNSFQIFVVSMGNTKITEELDLQGYKNTMKQNIRKKGRNYLDNEEATKNSESPSDKIE